MHDREYRVTCRDCDYETTHTGIGGKLNADDAARSHQRDHPDHRVGYSRVDTPPQGGA